MMMVQNVNSRSIHVYVLTISRFMLHRAAAAKASNFWPLIFALYDGGSLVDLALVSLLSHVYSYSICCMSESMFSAYTKKKKIFSIWLSFCLLHMQWMRMYVHHISRHVSDEKKLFSIGYLNQTCKVVDKPIRTS